MPSPVRTPKEEKIWNFKKAEVCKQTGKKISDFTDNEWRRVNFLFQKAKKKYKGRLPKKYHATASFKELVTASYTIVALKPLEHFKSSGTQPFWSIQTERTHGKKGIIRISKTQLEDPALSLQTGNYSRVAGAEDIFQGSKEGLMAYIKDRYEGFSTLEFRNT